MSEFNIYYPNPSEIVYRLTEANWKYVNDRGSDFAYSNVTAIPLLFAYVVERERMPSAADCANYLWGFRAKALIKTGRDNELARMRTRKLVQDFFRELHTFGMLAQSNLFGSVRYAKAEDIDLGVDYTAILSTKLAVDSDRLGIQSAMRVNWKNDQFTKIKEGRRGSRGSEKKWTGPIYWITNENRREESVGGVWLFTPEHVQDLVEEILGKSLSDTVAIQIRMEGVE